MTAAATKQTSAKTRYLTACITQAREEWNHAQALQPSDPKQRTARSQYLNRLEWRIEAYEMALKAEDGA